jgi:hypothetical protein
MTKASILLAIFSIISHLCIAQMNPQYESYVTWAAYPGENKIYQTVIVDGTTTGGCTFTYVCGPNNQQCTGTYPWCSTARHYARITNVVNGVGGTSTGPQISPFQYMSYQTTTVATVEQGEEVPSSWEGAAICTVIGEMFKGGGGPFLSLAVTTVETVQDAGAGVCISRADCTGGVTPRCNIGIVHEGHSPCDPGHVCASIAYRFTRSGPYSCSIAGCAPTTTLPGPCTQ